MAVETAEEAEKPKEGEKKEEAPKEVGAIGRASELYFLMGAPVMAFILYDGSVRLSNALATILLLIPLALLGGVLSKGSPPKPKESETPAAADPKAKAA